MMWYDIIVWTWVDKLPRILEIVEFWEKSSLYKQAKAITWILVLEHSITGENVKFLVICSKLESKVISKFS